MTAGPHALWDWPTRLFHWTLVLALPLAWWTAEEGHMAWHERIGIAVLALVLFRLAWGFLGSAASRFSSFVRGPGAVLNYLRGRKSPASEVAGHNPLGGWSVLVLLALLLLQATSGLFNSDDILFDGPLHHVVESDWQDRFGWLHNVLFNTLLGFVCLHLLAVAWHQWGRGEPMIQAMLRGHATGREGMAPVVPGWRALVVLAIAGLAIWGMLAAVPAPVSPW